MLTQTAIASLLNVNRSRVRSECAILQMEDIIEKYSQTNLKVLNYERLLHLAGRLYRTFRLVHNQPITQ